MRYSLRLSVKFFLVFFVLLGILCYFLLSTLNKTIKPSVRTATEIALISSARFMANIAADDMASGNLQHGELNKIFSQIKQTPLHAQVGQHSVEPIQQNVYVTDDKGIVLYDSEQRHIGKDYSQWRDVYLTLKGQYGARSTRSDPDDPQSSIMYVAMPIYQDDKIIGVLSVSQANQFLDPVIFKLERDLLRSGAIMIGICFILGLILVVWISRSIDRLTDYAKNITRDRKTPLPRLSSPELVLLANALVEMREKLDHKSYIETYVHTLTHELKSPISAILGATEILKTNPPESHRDLFIDNIETQSKRLQSVIEHLLMLAQLDVTPQCDYRLIMCRPFISEIVDALAVKAKKACVTLSISCSDTMRITADPFWLKQALINLIDNAIDFSPANGCIEISVSDAMSSKAGSHRVDFIIQDQGSGIPEFAADKIFERFYSLPRGDGHKSSGIGLTLVKAVALLHQGTISIKNRNETQGTIAILSLPAMPIILDDPLVAVAQVNS